MKKRLRTALFLLCVLIITTGLTGCSTESIETMHRAFDRLSDRAMGAMEGAIDRATKEVRFTKTIHDFGDLRVENLDNRADTNFIVYAEGVKEIAMTEEANLLESANEEALEYVFVNPDEALLSMEEGDVFFGVSNSYESVCIKLKSAEVQEGRLIVHGDEVTLSDLFAYVDIDMDIDYTQLYFDPESVPDGCTVEYERTSAGMGNGDARLLVAGPGTAEGQFTTLAMTADRAAVATNTASAGNAAGGLRIGTSLNVSKTAVVAQSTVSMLIHSVHMEFRFAEGELFASSVVNSSVEFDASITLRGDVFNIQQPLFGITVPVGGPVIGKIYPTFVFEGSGEIQVGMTSVQNARMGYTLRAGLDSGFNWNPISDWSQPTVTPRLEDVSGNIKIGVKATVSISCMMLADIHTSIFGGLELRGSYDLFAKGMEKMLSDSVHDCRFCIDGDAYLLFELSVGAGIGFLPNQRRYQSELTLLHEDEKLCDFYLSYGAGGSQEFEFGWNAVCPHRRYRTQVTVLNEAGEFAEGAEVTATYADGRTETVRADGAGLAEFFLPEGSNGIAAVKGGESASMTVAVTDDPPITAILRLQGQMRLFVYCFLVHDEEYQPLDTYPELVALIQSKYPDAIWLSDAEWAGLTDRMQEGNGPSAGDVVAYIYAHNMHTEGYSFIWVDLWKVLLPGEAEDAEDSAAETNAEQRQDVPVAGVVYSLRTGTYSPGWRPLNSGLFNDSYCESCYYLIDESIYHGLEYDENYRITNIGTGWTYTQRKEDAPMLEKTSDFHASSIYQPLVLRFVEESFQYLDLLLADTWIIDVQ